MLKYVFKCTHPPQRLSTEQTETYDIQMSSLPGTLVRSSSCLSPSPEDWHSAGHYPFPSSPVQYSCQHLLHSLQTSKPAVSSSMRFPSNMRMALNIMPFFQLQWERIWQIPRNHFISACFIRVE